MNEQEKDYILTHRAWVRSTELNQEEIKLSMEYNNNMISILSRKIEDDKKHIALIEEFRQAGIKGFDAWCSGLGFDPNIQF